MYTACPLIDAAEHAAPTNGQDRLKLLSTTQAFFFLIGFVHLPGPHHSSTQAGLQDPIFRLYVLSTFICEFYHSTRPQWTALSWGGAPSSGVVIRLNLFTHFVVTGWDNIERGGGAEGIKSVSRRSWFLCVCVFCVGLCDTVHPTFRITTDQQDTENADGVKRCNGYLRPITHSATSAQSDHHVTLFHEVEVVFCGCLIAITTVQQVNVITLQISFRLVANHRLFHDFHRIHPCFKSHAP